MKTQLAHTRLFNTLVLLVSLCVGASAQDNTPPQAYSAVAVGTGGAWAPNQSHLISASRSTRPMKKSKILRNW